MASPDRLHELIEAMAPFLDHLQLPVAAVDAAGRYVYYNRESAQLDGCSVEDSLHKKVTDVYPRLLAENSTLMQALQGREYHHHRQDYYNSRGRLVKYEHTTVPLRAPDGKVLGAIEVGYDLSQEAALQRQILDLNRRLAALQSGSDSARDPGPQIVTRSPKMTALIGRTRRYAAGDVPVVIYGESGTGKELFAQLVHAASPRSGRPFVVLNCGSLSETLVESSLFGTVRGAYTGAENTEGLLASADGGTLFLDEFSSMPLPMQVKLLRFLQQKTWCRVGDHRVRHADVRIVAAMNERPETLIAQGRLRADLFYRIAVAYLEIPPLRERPEDVEALARHFVEKYADDVPCRIEGISDEGLQALHREWPGNVRMLENVIVRSMILQEKDGPLAGIVFETSWEEEAGRTPVTEDEEPPRAAPGSSAAQALPLAEYLTRCERARITEALNRTEGNVSAAAQMLGMRRTTLSYRIRRLGIRIGVRGPVI